MNFEQYIAEKVGEERLYVVDSESVDDFKEYRSLLNDLLSISGSNLKLENFTANLNENKKKIDITIKVNNKDYRFSVNDFSGWIDPNNLIIGLNNVLADNNLKEKFYHFWAFDSFAQEIGFFYTHQNLGSEIIHYAKKYNENITESAELYQITDGITEEGYQDL